MIRWNNEEVNEDAVITEEEKHAVTYFVSSHSRRRGVQTVATCTIFENNEYTK